MGTAVRVDCRASPLAGTPSTQFALEDFVVLADGLRGGMLIAVGVVENLQRPPHQRFRVLPQRQR